MNKQLAHNPTETRKQKLLLESREIEKNLQKSYREERSAAEHRAVSAIRRNSKYFYSYAKKYSKVFTGIGPLIDAADSIITCTTRMAEVLAEQYQSVFSTPRETLKEPHEIFNQDH